MSSIKASNLSDLGSLEEPTTLNNFSISFIVSTLGRVLCLLGDLISLTGLSLIKPSITKNLKNSLIDESFLKVVFLEIFLLFISSNHPEMCSLLSDKTERLYFLFINFTNSRTSAIYALLVFTDDIFSEIIISL